MPKGHKGITYSICHPNRCVASLESMLCCSCYKQADSWRDYEYRTNYGITLADYNALLEAQGGACKLCQWIPKPGNRRLAVDHCHKTGRIRGLLCGLCNKAVGKVEQVGLNLVEAYLAY